MKRVFLLFIIFVTTFNGWIEDKIERPKPTKQEIKKRLSLNYTNIIKSVNEYKTNYSIIQNKFLKYTNYTKILLETLDISNQPDKIAEYKIKYLDINKTLKNEQDNINNILNLIDNTIVRIKLIKNNLIKSNNDSIKTISITSNIFNKYNNRYTSYKTDLTTKKNTLSLFIEKITDINIKIENQIQNTNKLSENIKRQKEKTLTSNIKKRVITPTSAVPRKSLRIKPKSKKLFKEANKFFNKGKYDKALKLYKEAVKQDKKNYFAMENISKIYLKKGNIDKAIEQINKAIKTFKEQQ